MLRKGRVVKTLPTPHQPGGIAAVADSWVALVAVSARVLEVYDVHSLKPLGPAPGRGRPQPHRRRPALQPTSPTPRATRSSSSRSAATRACSARPPRRGPPTGSRSTRVRSRLWVTDTATNRLTEYSTLGATAAPLATYPTVRQPNSVDRRRTHRRGLRRRPRRRPDRADRPRRRRADEAPAPAQAALPKLPKPPVPKFPEEPPPGPTRPSFWRSPLRGPWLTSILGSALLPLILICAVTGFLSQAAYNPGLGHNSLLPGGGLGVNIYFFHWPTSPSWLYAFTQGLHVISGLAAMPILLAKLWSVMPKLFEWPPVRGAAHALERLSLALLVGGSVFVFGTGLLNIQVFYPWPFRFLTAHYYGAFVFLAAFGLHIFLKIPVALRTFRERGVLRPLRPGLADTVAEPYEEGHVAPLEPARPTISRRALLATVGAASLGAAFMAFAQTVGGPLRQLGLLTPRSTQLNHGPNGFQINKTAAAVGIGPKQTGAAWRLQIEGRGEARVLPRAAAGDAPVQLRPADRLRRRLVDDPALDRGAAARPGRPGGGAGRRRGAGRIAAEGRRAARGDAQLRPGRAPRTACWR